MKKCVAAALAIFVLFFSLFSCGGKPEGARDLLGSLLSLVEDLPAGGCYATTPRAKDQVLDARLTESLYRRSDGYLEYEGRVAEAAVYLGSAPDPFFEAAVFVCYGNADTRAVVEMCMRRARLIEAHHAAFLGDIALSVSGRVVAYVIARDTEAAQGVLDRLF